MEIYTFRFLVDKSYLNVQISTYHTFIICRFVIQNNRYLVCKHPLSKSKSYSEKTGFVQFPENSVFSAIIFQKMLFKSV